MNSQDDVRIRRLLLPTRPVLRREDERVVADCGCAEKCSPFQDVDALDAVRGKAVQDCGRGIAYANVPTDNGHGTTRTREKKLPEKRLQSQMFRREGRRHDPEAEVWPVTEPKEIVGAALEFEAEQTAHSAAAREVGVRGCIRPVEG